MSLLPILGWFLFFNVATVFIKRLANTLKSHERTDSSSSSTVDIVDEAVLDLKRLLEHTCVNEQQTHSTTHLDNDNV